VRFRQLRYFVSVAETGSFTKASGMLNIAQPALSNQIGTLETELGVRLLDRRSNGVEVTPAGSHLLERAKEIISLLNDTKESVKRFGQSSRIKINVGLPTTTTGIMAIPLLEKFSRSHPEVNLQIVEGMTGHLEKWLLQEEIGVALLFAAPETERLSVQHIGQERLVVIGPFQGDMCMRETLRFGEVVNLPIIHSTPAHQLRRMLDRMAARICQPINYVAEIDSLAQINLMVRAGRGYTVLPMRYAATDWSGPDIRIWELECLPDDPDAGREVGIVLVATPSFMREDCAEGLLTEMKGTIQNLIASGQWPGATLDPAAEMQQP